MNIETRKEDLKIDTDLNERILSGALAQELGLSERELGLALGIANLRLKSGKPETALQIYAMLVLMEPMNVKYQCGLANGAIQLQEYEIALQAASAVVAIAPRDCRGYYFSGAACLGLKQFAEAKEDITAALEFATDDHDRDIRLACERLNLQLNAKLS